MQNEIKSELVVLDFDCPEHEINTLLGLEPTTIVRKGDVKKKGPEGTPSVLHEENVWVLKSDLSPTASIEAHINGILDLLVKHGKDIASVTTRYETELSVYGFSNDATRIAFHLDKATCKRLAGFGLSLDLDIYPIA